MAQVVAARMPSRRRWRELGLTLALALQLAAAAAAQPVDDTINADRPGLADGSKLVGAGRVQVETGLQREDRSGNGTRFRTLLRVGLTDKVEFRV